MAQHVPSECTELAGLNIGRRFHSSASKVLQLTCTSAEATTGNLDLIDLIDHMGGCV